MPITSLEDMREALKDSAQLDDIVEFVLGAIEAEKTRGQQLKKAADKQAIDRRLELQNMRTALQKVGLEDGADFDEFLEDLAEKLGSAESGATPSSDSDLAKELKKLRRDFERTKKELDSERQQSTELKTKSARRIMKAKLADAFRDKVYGHDLLANDLINDGRVTLEDDTEDVVFVDGEDRIAFDDGVKRVLEQRTDILKNQQTPGAKTAATQTKSSKGLYTRSQLEAMSREEIAEDRDNVYASWEAIRANENAAG